jgi:hypothetical protein
MIPAVPAKLPQGKRGHITACGFAKRLLLEHRDKLRKSSQSATLSVQPFEETVSSRECLVASRIQTYQQMAIHS